MKQTTNGNQACRAKRGERGAALITVLLISMLLLVAGAALIASTAMTAQTTFDATAEAQAYYAAEAGLQASLNVLRGNVQPDPLFAANPSGGYAAENKFNFRDAVNKYRSNKSGDEGDSRLSRWLQYNATYTDRVIVSPSNPANYLPLTGLAFSITVTDPDDPLGAALAADASYEPGRLLVSSIGYGPRGARKELELVVGRAAFNINPPATITVRGADDGSSMTFNLGSSAAKGYTGVDYAGHEDVHPTIAISLPDWREANDGIKKPETIGDPELSVLNYFNNAPEVLPTPWPSGNDWKPYPLTSGNDGRDPQIPTPKLVETPPFLKTATAARTFLYGVTGVMEIAKAQGNYVTSYTGYVGTQTNPRFLFVDGNCELSGGEGLLVVTGNLELNGNDDFRGLILVMGAGSVTRKGSGNGGVLGSWIIAKFGRTSGNFEAPYFDVSGGGNGDFNFDSEARDKANKAGGRPTLGVVEK